MAYIKTIVAKSPEEFDELYKKTVDELEDSGLRVIATQMHYDRSSEGNIISFIGILFYFKMDGSMKKKVD